MKRLLVTCDKQLELLNVVNTDVLHFKNMWDIQPFKGPVIYAETIVFDSCDKNFVYYWTVPRVLPSAKRVYLFSHPCEPLVFRTLDKMNVSIIINEHWSYYVQRWVPSMLEEGKIKIIKEFEAKNFLNNLNRIMPDLT